MRTPILGLALALCAGAALAQTPTPTPAPAPEATVAGSPSAADQIDAFIKATPVPDVTRDAAPGVTSSAEPADRKIHGVVELGVGSNGYRHAYGRADMPLGDTGSLSVAIDETRFKDRFKDRFGGRLGQGRGLGVDSVSLGAAFGSANPLASCRRRSGGDPLDAGYAGAPYGPDAPGACRPIERTAP